MADRLESSRQGRTGRCRRGARTALDVVALVVVVVLGAGACGSASKSSGTTPSTTVPAVPSRDAVIAQVVVSGGFIGPNVLAGRVPSVTVLGDGSVVTPAAVPAIFPGPAITPLQLGHVSAAQVARLIADARRLGLLGGPLDFGSPTVSDLGTTIVRIGDGTHPAVVHSAYAFGIDSPTSGLTGRQRAARRALQSFVDELQALPRGDRIFTPRAVAVFTLTGGSFSGPVPPRRPWPIATRPRNATAGKLGCIIVFGREVAPLLAALAHANENTPWLVGGHTLSLSFRPLVVGNEGCTL